MRRRLSLANRELRRAISFGTDRPRLPSFSLSSLSALPRPAIFRALNELSVYASATRGNCLSARWRCKKRVAPFTAPHVLARSDHHRRRWLKDLHGREIGYEGYLFEGRLQVSIINGDGTRAFSLSLSVLFSFSFFEAAALILSRGFFAGSLLNCCVPRFPR